MIFQINTAEGVSYSDLQMIDSTKEPLPTGQQMKRHHVTKLHLPSMLLAEYVATVKTS